MDILRNCFTIGFVIFSRIYVLLFCLSVDFDLECVLPHIDVSTTVIQIFAVSR